MLLGRERSPSKQRTLEQRYLTVQSDIEKQRHSSRATIGQTLRGVTMKKVWCGEDETRSQSGNDANWENKCVPMSFFVQALHMPRSKNSSGVYRSKYKRNAHFSLVSISPRTRSRPGAERIRQGEGRLSRPPKTALARSDLTEKFMFRETHTEAETKKTPDQIKKQKTKK